MFLQANNIKNFETAINTNEAFYTSIWFWLSVIEFVIIIIHILKITNPKKKLAFHNSKKKEKDQAKKASIDMDNLMSSINNSRDLYKILSRKCHPDRFIGTPLYERAEILFQEISNNRRNFERLSELKELATKDLNINI